jgi:hypothetical protein
MSVRDSGELRVGMVGYAFMGAAHSQAWRTVNHFFDLPLAARMSVVCGRSPDGVAAAAEASPNSIQDGPKDYQPSDTLWAAFESYEKGDYPAAARSAAMAAEAGDSGAQQFLGGLYASGHGVPVDKAAAVKYYTLAAEQGWSEAMNNLGKAYETGQGIARNQVEALKWYLLASKRPTDDSEVIQRNIRNVSGAMSIDDISRASELAKKWELAHPH